MYNNKNQNTRQSICNAENKGSLFSVINSSQEQILEINEKTTSNLPDKWEKYATNPFAEVLEVNTYWYLHFLAQCLALWHPNTF